MGTAPVEVLDGEDGFVPDTRVLTKSSFVES